MNKKAICKYIRDTSVILVANIITLAIVHIYIEHRASQSLMHRIFHKW
jgi:hypothetical protein